MELVLLATCPFFFVHKSMFRAVWSLPFGTYGGPLEIEGSGARVELLARYNKLRTHWRVMDLGWVDFYNTANESDGAIEHLSTHLVDLGQGFDHVWNHGYSKKKRQYARRAERSGVKVDLCEGLDGIADCYSIFVNRMDRWGRRMLYPLELFQELLTRDSEHVKLYRAHRDGVTLGGHFIFYYRDMVLPWFGMASVPGDELQAGSLLYARCMRDAAEQGFETYNIGGSLGKSSLVEFKEALGAKPYDYQVVGHRSIAFKMLMKVRGRR